MKIIPKQTLLYSTTTIPEFVGQFFSVHVHEESKQRILVIRENLTSYTLIMYFKLLKYQ